MSDGGDLFDGVEDSVSVSSNDPVEGSDSVNAQQTLQTLTYKEVHSGGVGFCPMITGFALLLVTPVWGVAFIGLSLGLSFAALLGRSPNSSLRYIVKEPHYLLGGQAIAALSGILIHGFASIIANILGVLG